MDLRSYLPLLVRRWPIFLIVTIVVGGLLGGASFLIPPVYTAKTEILISARPDADTTVDERRLGAQYVSERVSNYASLVTTETVMSPVIESLDLDMSVGRLADEITVEIPSGTTVLAVAVAAGSATGAAEIATEIAKTLPTAIAQIEGATTAAASPVVVSVIDPASPPQNRTSPNVLLNLIIAGLLGLLAGVLVAVLVDNFDNRVRRGADVTPLGVPYLGGLSFVRGKAVKDLLVFRDQPAEMAAAYRRLGIDVLFQAGEQPVSVLVTSVTTGAGKTTVAAGIAAAWQRPATACSTSTPTCAVVVSPPRSVYRRLAASPICTRSGSASTRRSSTGSAATSRSSRAAARRSTSVRCSPVPV